MARDRIITSGISDIWRNRNHWLHLGKPKSPVIETGSIRCAKSQTYENTRRSLFGIRVQIMIYEAQPDKYECLDDIKI